MTFSQILLYAFDTFEIRTSDGENFFNFLKTIWRKKIGSKLEKLKIRFEDASF